MSSQTSPGGTKTLRDFALVIADGVQLCSYAALGFPHPTSPNFAAQGCTPCDRR